MPSAKAAYDPNEGCKHRQFNSAQWDALGARLRQKLRPFYPNKAAVECETFGHPADEWANYSLKDHVQNPYAQAGIDKSATLNETSAVIAPLAGNDRAVSSRLQAFRSPWVFANALMLEASAKAAVKPSRGSTAQTGA